MFASPFYCILYRHENMSSHKNEGIMFSILSLTAFGYQFNVLRSHTAYKKYFSSHTINNFSNIILGRDRKNIFSVYNQSKFYKFSNYGRCKS